MFAYIKGILASKGGSHVVIEAGGIGYRIGTSATTLSALGAIGSETFLHTHFHVREESVGLYGFATQEELVVFELLIMVSGVGPKAALSVISSMSPSTFSLAVITSDAAALTRVQGIGAKTAQKIILELKDKIRKEQLTALGVAAAAGPQTAGRSSVISEAISALMILGYTAVESSNAVTAAYKDGCSLEALIRDALKAFIVR